MKKNLQFICEVCVNCLGFGEKGAFGVKLRQKSAFDAI